MPGKRIEATSKFGKPSEENKFAEARKAGVRAREHVRARVCESLNMCANVCVRVCMRACAQARACVCARALVGHLEVAEGEP
eukprot:1424281-Pleurochrysis_carterae.AAC.1